MVDDILDIRKSARRASGGDVGEVSAEKQPHTESPQGSYVSACVPGTHMEPISRRLRGFSPQEGHNPTSLSGRTSLRP